MRLSRVLAAPAAAGIMVLAQAVGIGPAQAATTDLACNYDFSTFDACLNITPVGLNQWNVHVGLDAVMSQRNAQEIIDNGAVFRATLYGDDGGGRRQFLTSLTLMPGWPAAGPEGLGAELSANVPGSILDEDKNDEDEIFAEISYFDFHKDKVVKYVTGTVHGEFAEVTEGGGGGCFVVCP